MYVNYFISKHPVFEHNLAVDGYSAPAHYKNFTTFISCGKTIYRKTYFDVSAMSSIVFWCKVSKISRN